MEEKTEKYKYLERGDLVRLAKQLGVPHQTVRDVSSGKYENILILMTIEKLNDRQRKAKEETSDTAVEAILKDKLKSKSENLKIHRQTNI